MTLPFSVTTRPPAETTTGFPSLWVLGEGSTLPVDPDAATGAVVFVGSGVRARTATFDCAGIRGALAYFLPLLQPTTIPSDIAATITRKNKTAVQASLFLGTAICGGKTSFSELDSPWIFLFGFSCSGRVTSTLSGLTAVFALCNNALRFSATLSAKGNNFAISCSPNAFGDEENSCSTPNAPFRSTSGMSSIDRTPRRRHVRGSTPGSDSVSRQV